MIDKIKKKYRELFKKYGWKITIAIFLFYTIKGLLYLAIPWFIASRFMDQIFLKKLIHITKQKA